MARLNFTTLTEAVISGVDSAGNPRHLRIDSNTESIQTISYEHHEIHAGSSFTTDYTVELVRASEPMTNILLIIIIIELAALWLQHGRVGKLLNERVDRWLIKRAQKRRK